MPTLPALDPQTIEAKVTTVYPPPFDQVVAGRSKRALTAALGLTQFGVNVTTLAPGAKSGIRHWHSHEDEFVYVLQGRVVLITDAGEQLLEPGMCAGFPAGVPDGHSLHNRGDGPAVLLEIGTRDDRDEAHYSDVDLYCGPGRYTKPVFTRRNGQRL